ncbi:hypothetical protein LCM23_06205 [Cytobacillus kochii]|uniref:hypothetical protein n=1 Tax=Cytobacillus kochii TaxID=859143 RepID=UPI001CD4F344|nr:hypothetical protein [Cytobacillus kochii]MCA1025677.1 hypothetical protein [Cytobacillus kochii]
MGSRLLKAMQEVGKHATGNLNSLKVKTVANGALVEGAAIDNFTAVELGFNANGERTVKQLSDVTKKTYLIASPETRYMGEAIGDFYNEVGERARIVIFEEAYTRFDTSAYTGEPANGKFAHFDPATKKFLIHDGTHADYETASAKFLVVNDEQDIEYTLGQPLVRLEVIEA